MQKMARRAGRCQSRAYLASDDARFSDSGYYTSAFAVINHFDGFGEGIIHNGGNGPYSLGFGLDYFSCVVEVEFHLSLAPEYAATKLGLIRTQAAKTNRLIVGTSIIKPQRLVKPKEIIDS
jgi:hypothetical protein